MSKNITSYSGVHARNLSCCKFFFPCEETGLASNGYITDVINGLILQPSLGGGDWNITNGSTTVNSVYPNAFDSDGDEIPMTGLWPNFGSNSILIVAAAHVVFPDYAKLPVGNGSLSNAVYPFDDVTVSWDGGMHTLVKDVNNHATVVTFDLTRKLTINHDVIIVVRVDHNGTTNSDVFKTDGTLETDPVTPANTLSQSVSTNPLTATINPGVGASSTRVNGLALYGWAGFSFTGGIPADWKSACFWMGADWMNKSTNRYLYPGWSGVT